MAFVVPYLAIMMPLLMSYHGRPIPAGIPVVGGFDMLFTIVFLTLFAQRPTRKQTGGVPVQPNPQVAASARRGGFALIGLWSLLFLYGAAKVFSGSIPLNRGIPAGVLLLSFIGVFSWFMYRDRRNGVG